MIAVTPVLDIVIPVRDNLPWLRMCLTAISAFTENPYVVTIVDNDSQGAETKRWLDEVPACAKTPEHGRVQVLRLSTNESFSSSVNAGVAAGAAPNIVILNSDAIVTKGWDAAFLADLAHHDVGLTGAQTNAASGAQAIPQLAQQFAGPSFSALIAGGRDFASAPYLIFFAVATRRETWNKIGPLDGKTCRGWGGGEDLDWSWRVIDAGLRCVVSAAFVLHGCSATYTEQGIDPETKSKFEASNIEALVKKHGETRVRRGTRLKSKAMIASFHRTEYVLHDWANCLQANMLDLHMNGWDFQIHRSQRQLIDWARCFAVENALKIGERAWGTPGGNDFDYLVMLDDDHTFPQVAIRQLLVSGKPIVSALAYRRTVNVMDPTKADHSACVFRWSDTTKRDAVTSLDGIEGTGLQRVDATGFGMVAIRMDVILELKRRHPGKKLFDFSVFGEDIGFCKMAGEAGFDTWCDTDLVIGHIGDHVVVDGPYVKRWREQVVAAGGLKR